MWWAIVTLSTVGFGDAVPVTALGKLFGGLTIIVGMCVFALPIGIIANGFAQELQRRNFVVTWALLARVPLFAGLDGQATSQIMSLMKSETYDEGETIVHKGDASDAMYFIASGAAIVETEQGDVTLGEGDFFGELGLIDKRSRTHTVIASANRTRCLVLDRDDLERLGRRMPHVVGRIREVAEARRRANAENGVKLG
jgi:voltage-gated potassium channel